MGWQIALVVTCEMLQFPRPFAVGWFYFWAGGFDFSRRVSAGCRIPKILRAEHRGVGFLGVLWLLLLILHSLCILKVLFTLWKKCKKFKYIREDI